MRYANGGGTAGPLALVALTPVTGTAFEIVFLMAMCIVIVIMDCLTRT